MLDEVHIYDGEILKATKRSSDWRLNVELLTPEKKLTEKAKQAFTEIFGLFSKDGQMSEENCATFIKACCGMAPLANDRLVDFAVDISDSRVQDVFKGYDPSKRKYLVLSDFLQFYEKSAQDSYQTVCENLKTLGYGADLTRATPTATVFTSRIEDCRRLPRYILANNAKSFELLFNISSTIPS